MLSRLICETYEAGASQQDPGEKVELGLIPYSPGRAIKMQFQLPKEGEFGVNKRKLHIPSINAYLELDTNLANAGRGITCRKASAKFYYLPGTSGEDLDVIRETLTIAGLQKICDNR